MTKMNIMWTKVFVVLLGFLVCCGYSQDLSMQERKAAEKLGGSIETFSWQILLRSCLDLPNTNIVLSPFSVWTMLSVISEGSSQYTREELEKALRHPKDFKKFAYDGFSGMMKSIRKNSNVQINIVNSLFYDKHLKIKPEYEKLIRNSYYTHVLPVDFRNATTMDYINNHVMKNTNEKIDYIVNNGDLTDGKMLITNGMYFKGQWSNGFDTKKTITAPFFDENGKMIGKVNMMRNLGKYIHVKSKLLKSNIVEVPYGAGKLTLILIIPENGVKLYDVYKKFTQFHFADLFAEYASANTANEKVDLFMPRFKMTSHLTMNQILQNMGMYDVFDPRYADLSLMGSNLDKICVNRVLHKAEIEVDEEGVTNSSPVNTNNRHEKRPVKIIANKPFIFVVLEKVCKSMVMGGVYRVPELY